MWIEESAPSNIALIKYMGKILSAKESEINKPANVSVSYTLDNLRTYVRIQKKNQIISHQTICQTADEWTPLIREGLMPISLSEKGLSKFINYFQFLKKEFRLTGFYKIESANNFPSDCGLASSASSYAALTTCVHSLYLSESDGRASKYTSKELSKLSQKGSGSSCRSFFSPWGLWHENGAEEIKFDLSYSKFIHMVILCDESVKIVSSSQAHSQVLTSDLFKDRPNRATNRFHDLSSLLRKKYNADDWKKIFQICWNEFWDMHVLFHTSNPPFMYMNSDSQKVLTSILNLWNKSGDGPIVTMDAGNNVHLLFREDQIIIYDEYLNLFSQDYNLWAKNGYRKRK